MARSAIDTLMTANSRVSGSRIKDAAALVAAGSVAGFAVYCLGIDWRAAVVAAAFAMAGFAVRGVDISGAFAGAAVAYTLMSVAGWQMFAVLFVVFAFTWLATRAGRSRKSALGLAEKKSGRSAAQVMANLAVAAIAMAAASCGFNRTLALMIAVAVLAEAAADTVSSEVGQAFAQRAFLVTNGKSVSVGTNGAVSVVGTLAGVGAACVVIFAGHALGILPWMNLVLLAALFGTVVDSLLGATVENRGWLDNDAVNFLATASAAGLVALFTS